MTKQTFEEFLEQVFYYYEPGFLKDEIEDRFNDWLGGLETDDWLKLGDVYLMYIENPEMKLDVKLTNYR